MELEPGDRRRRNPAGSRDSDQLRELARYRIPLERSHDARRNDEDRGDGCKRELEAGVEEQIRVPAEEHGGTHQERLPPVALASGKPRKRAEPGGERGPYDRRMEPHCHRVSRDRQKHRDLREVAPEAQEQDHRCSPAANRRDLQPVDRQTVVQTRGPKIVEQPRVHLGRAAQHDRLDHLAPLTLQARRTVALEPPADAVARAGYSATAPDDPPRLAAQDGVNPLAAEPFRLVEAVRRSGRSPQLADQRQDRALGRCAAERQLEIDGLMGRKVPQRSTSAFIRWSKLPARGGSCTSTTARSAVPIRDASTLWSRCETRRLPQPQARVTSAEASRAQRTRVVAAARPSAPRRTKPTSACTGVRRPRFASAKPTQRLPTAACGRRTLTSRDHETLQLRHVRRPDSGDALQFGDRMECAVLLPVVEDLLRGHRPYPGQVLELFERRGVEVERG